MVTEIRIYYEGDSALREGFRGFFRSIESACQRPLRLIAGRGRDQAIGDFRKDQRRHPEALKLLLIDSEGPDNGRLFETVCRPHIAESSKVFWMVECMEAWFLADENALSRYYQMDLESALRGNPNVEEIPKKDVIERLKHATGGRYHKTKDAPHILKAIRADLVKQAAPNCRRLFDAIPRLLNP